MKYLLDISNQLSTKLWTILFFFLKQVFFSSKFRYKIKKNLKNYSWWLSENHCLQLLYWLLLCIWKWLSWAMSWLLCFIWKSLLSCELIATLHLKVTVFSSNQKQELSVAAMFVNGSGWNEQSLQGIFHRCFLPSFSSFGQAVSEEKIFLNWSIRNKNCLWRPCL
jgi:hypothetical protein